VVEHQLLEALNSNIKTTKKKKKKERKKRKEKGGSGSFFMVQGFVSSFSLFT
jgi:hypothetical protein